ncbi:hypothetical protein PR202_gb01674 [Eleusine coracana subsp. coracana]|uniref:Cysteine proteinase inhibitor n=1 Tax=Eleusine coracana subsp. coracana TaxID=191504 RepID=A0AAV5DWI7_ELECO|nr:hypothetical protein PR202_gb01674 [Eleusine coracana subsp. coracana]
MSFSCSCFPPRNRSHRTAPMPERPKECIITWHRITERPMRRVICGGIQDAPGRENDLKLIKLARFAVAEYKKKTVLRSTPFFFASSWMLKFERLVKVRHQLVSGMLYFFTVKVKEGCTKKLYEATVWEQSWTNFKQLSSFRPVATETTTTA